MRHSLPEAQHNTTPYQKLLPLYMCRTQQNDKGARSPAVAREG